MPYAKCINIFYVLVILIFISSCIRKPNSEVVDGHLNKDQASSINEKNNLQEEEILFLENEEVVNDIYIGKVDIGDRVILILNGRKTFSRVEIETRNMLVEYDKYFCVDLTKCYSVKEEMNCEYHYMNKVEETSNVDIKNINSHNLRIYIGNKEYDLKESIKINNGFYKLSIKVEEDDVRNGDDLSLKLIPQKENILTLGFKSLGPCEISNILRPKPLGDTNKYYEKVVDSYEYKVTAKVVKENL